MKLYGSFTSPYVRKARILVLEKSIDCEFVEELTGHDNERLNRLNPLVKIPVLEVDETRVLYDSPVIVEYLDSLDGESLIPGGQDRWEVQRLHALGDGVLDAVVARMIEARRPEQSRMDEVIEKQEQKVANALASLNRAVRQRDFLVGDSYTLADLAIGVALEYIDFRYAHDWRTQYPELAFWLASISARAPFKQTVPPGMENSARTQH